jgi:uncharacterized surface protein with fasciclin (FAS1) repeats
MTTPLYFTQVWDNTHMYDVKKKATEFKRKKANVGTILDYIENDPTLSKYAYLVHLSNYDTYLNDPNANCTIFIARDKDLEYLGEDYFEQIDRGSAVKLMNYSTCPYQFYLRDLDTQFGLIETRGNMRMRLERDKNRIVIDRKQEITEGDIQTNNGVIHVASGLLCPEYFV